MAYFDILLFDTSPTPAWPSGITIIGWVVAAIVALVYLFSGVLQNLSTGRKELLEVSDKKMENVTKEKDELTFQVKELKAQIEQMNLEKAGMEKDQVLLLREHHKLLEISVDDLKTLTNNIKRIEQLEEEIDRYREEKGLKPKFIHEENDN